MAIKAEPDFLNINLLRPILQTSAVTAINAISGKLNHYSVSFPHLTLVASLASLVSAVTKKLFNNVISTYNATALGITISFVAQHLITKQTVNSRTVLMVAAPLILTEIFFDILHFTSGKD
ncbi:hypothetical protein [Candidatus Protochlamydia amoebophila]|uniref:Uncharacterized protein n=1 Tax=Candidatus Protochlamydia amoebophila TaxID=362787 RepID=A0A0C1JK23_9BACT|nr:hypothetical protein [Candidatus Protochlamydia amoebophila]KIC71635.1 hypothetical protein DB44_DH00050 [Candidatus Protochlamydia amoebophila]